MRKQPHDWKLGGLSLLDQAVVSATNFLSMVILTHACPTAEVGMFALAWTVLGYLRTGQERLLAAPYLVFANQPGRDSSTLLGSNLIHQTSFALLSSLLVASFALVIRNGSSFSGTAPTLWILALALPFLLVRDHWRAIFGAHLRFDVSLSLDLAVSVVQLGGMGLLAWTGWLNAPTAMAMLGLACVLPAFLAFIGSPQSYRVEPTRLLPDWKLEWAYAKWLVIARAVGIAGYFLIPWMVAGFLEDAAAVGRYANCSNLVGLSLMFVMGVNNFFLPRTVQAYHAGGTVAMLRSVADCVIVLVSCLAAISVAFWFLGDWLLGIVYGADYSSSGEIAFLLSISTLAVCVSIACGNGLAALQRPKAYFWGEFSYFLVSVLIAWWLIPIYDLRGAAWALVGGGCAASLVTLATLLWLTRYHQPSIGGDHA